MSRKQSISSRLHRFQAWDFYKESDSFNDELLQKGLWIQKGQNLRKINNGFLAARKSVKHTLNLLNELNGRFCKVQLKTIINVAVDKT